MKCSRLLGLAAMAALFAIGCGEAALAQKKTVIRSVPIGNLRTLDPIWTTAYITRNHAYMIWDTLFALDADNKPQPQMVDTWSVSDDKLTYTFTLRDGLKWHDGPPVTAADCVASLRRWGAKDGMGQALMSYTASLDAVDAKTIQAGAQAADRLRHRRAGEDRQQRAVHDAGTHRQDRSEHGHYRDDRLGAVPFHRVGMGSGQQGRLREVRRLCAAQGAGEPGGRRQGRLCRSRRVRSTSRITGSPWRRSPAANSICTSRRRPTCWRWSRAIRTS